MFIETVTVAVFSEKPSQKSFISKEINNNNNKNENERTNEWMHENRSMGMKISGERGGDVFAQTIWSTRMLSVAISLWRKKSSQQPLFYLQSKATPYIKTCWHFLHLFNLTNNHNFDDKICAFVILIETIFVLRKLDTFRSLAFQLERIDKCEMCVCAHSRTDACTPCNNNEAKLNLVEFW